MPDVLNPNAAKRIENKAEPSVVNVHGERNASHLMLDEVNRRGRNEQLAQAKAEHAGRAVNPQIKHEAKPDMKTVVKQGPAHTLPNEKIVLPTLTIAQDMNIPHGAAASMAVDTARNGDHAWLVPSAMPPLFLAPSLADRYTGPDSRALPVASELGRIMDIAAGATAGVLGDVGNILGLGYPKIIAESKGAYNIGTGIAEHTADLLTFGGYKGYQKGGVSGAAKGVANSILPIREVETLLDPELSWDQRAGAAGSSVLKLITLGKTAGKSISSRPATAAELEGAQYGYHFSKNKDGIARTGFESRTPDLKPGLDGAVSKLARAVKDHFVEGEPRKAGYMFGTAKPGVGRLGSIDTTQTPVVIDLSKVNPKNLNFRPADGALVFTGDRIPSSALSFPKTWTEVPVGRIPLRANPLEVVPRVAASAVGNAAAHQASEQSERSGKKH